MRLREIMTTDVVSIGPEEAATTAWSRMQAHRIRHLVVQEGSRLLGVLSDRDLGGPHGGAFRKGKKVRDLMTPQATTAKPGTTLRQAANVMRGQLIGSLPVMEDGRLVGIVTATDVLDELGRGSTRPAVRAQRQDMRLPPAAARAATKRKRAGKTRLRTLRKRATAAGRGAGPEDGSAPITGRITPTLGRDRVRRPDSTQRAPLAEQVPRPEKRELGRGDTPHIPAYIRSVGAGLDEADKEYLRRKLGRKLGKFSSSVERVSVRVEDVNGPRGGVDKRCRIKAVLAGMPSAVVDEQHHALQAAMDGALSRIERAVRSAVKERRQKPLRSRAAQPMLS